MGKRKTFLTGASSSNPNIIGTIMPKTEILDFESPSNAMYSGELRDNIASSSQSNLRSFFTGMGFSHALVDKVIEENGEDNVDLLLEILMECTDPQKSNSPSPDSLDDMFNDNDARNPPECSAFAEPKEEPDLYGVYDDKRSSLLKMNFSAEEVDFAIEKLGVHAPVDEIVDFITAAQVAANSDEETIETLDDNPEIIEDISNEALFGTMEKTLRLLEMGFSENEISLAIERYGSEVPVLELANSICAEQAGEKYIIKNKYSLKQSRINQSNVASDVGSCSNKLKREDYGEDTLPHSSNLNLEEAHRGKKLKQPYVGDYPDTQFRNISFEDDCTDDPSSYFEPMWMEEKVDAENAALGISRPPKPYPRKTIDPMIAKPPYFFYGNVEPVTSHTWGKISQFFNNIEPEFVNTQLFSALSRKEGYVHNLPTENRFSILPKPPMSLEDAMPHLKKWWPSWDTRKQLSYINFDPTGASMLCDKLRRTVIDSRGSLLYEQRKDILLQCQKLNLVWVGPYKLAPIEPEFLELILGYPLNHTEVSGTSLIERLHSLRFSFQIDTLGYHLSVLKSMFPEGITMLSLFTGIGGAEVALHRLGIQIKGVASVETCEAKRRILRRWWQSSEQTGELEQLEDIQKLTTNKIEKLIEKFGGFDFIICQSPCTLSGKSPKIGQESIKPSAFDLTLFCEVVRVIQRVRSNLQQQRTCDLFLPRWKR